MSEEIREDARFVGWASLWTCLVVGAFLLASCTVSPTSTERVGNGKLEIQVLGTDKEGYTVKRFSDNGYNHYYVTGPTDTMTHTGLAAGKSTRYETTPTRRRE